MEELMIQLHRVKSKAMILQIANSFAEHGNQLLELCLNQDKNIAAKASWVYRTWAVRNEKKGRSFSGKMMTILQISSDEPVIRNLLGSFLDVGCAEKYKTELLDYCLKTLQQEKRAVAVHANALGILSQISTDYPELKNEIIETLSSLPLKPNLAVQYRLKRNFPLLQFKKRH